MLSAAPKGIQRILVVTPSYLPTVGGLERVTELLCREWQRQGLAIRIFRGAVEVDLDGAPVGSSRGPVALARASCRTDVILGVNAPLRQLPLTLLFWRKIVLQHHSMYSFAGGQPRRQRGFDLFRRPVIRRRPNIAVSDAVAAVMPPGALVRTLPNPVETFTTTMPCWPERRYQFLFVGRFTKDKGLDVFVDALAALPGDGRAAVVGSGPEKLVLRSPSARELIAQGRLDVLGALSPSEVARQMADSRWLVVPSRSETFGQVAIEGLSQGCGLIVSEVGGLARYVGKCALGFAAGDHHALADAMARALEFRDLPTEWIGPQAAFITNHSVEAAAREYLSLFEATVDVRDGRFLSMT